MYAAAAYATELVGANKLPKTKNEPQWKKRLEGKLKELSRDLDFVNNLLEIRRDIMIGSKKDTIFEERDSTL